VPSALFVQFRVDSWIILERTWEKTKPAIDEGLVNDVTGRGAEQGKSCDWCNSPKRGPF